MPFGAAGCLNKCLNKKCPSQGSRLGGEGGPQGQPKRDSDAASKRMAHIRLSTFLDPRLHFLAPKQRRERYARICVQPVASSSDNPHRNARTRETHFSRWLEVNPIVENSGISRIHRESGDQKRLCANEDQRSHTMTNRFLLGMSVILSTAIAAPVFAQAVAQESDAYALYLPYVGAEIGSAPSQQRDVSIVSPGETDTMPSAPSVRPWKAGNEMATRPWAAPMGHHQPTAVDVLEADSRLTIDQEDAKVDRIVRGICRGC